MLCSCHTKRSNTVNYYVEYYYINFLHSFRTECKLESPENVYKNHDYCHTIMREEDNSILKYNPDKKTFKTPFVIQYT